MGPANERRWAIKQMVPGVYMHTILPVSRNMSGTYSVQKFWGLLVSINWRYWLCTKCYTNGPALIIRCVALCKLALFKKTNDFAKVMQQVHAENVLGCHSHAMSCICMGLEHYNDVIMSMMASQITSLTIVYSIVYSGADQRKHQSSASLAFVGGPVNYPHKGTVTRKMFPFDDVIMKRITTCLRLSIDASLFIFSSWVQALYCWFMPEIDQIRLF